MCVVGGAVDGCGCGCGWPETVVVEGCWEVGWEGKMEVAWVSGGGWVVSCESPTLVDCVMVWESDCVTEPGSGGPRRSMPADSRGWRDSSSFWGVSDRSALGKGRGVGDELVGKRETTYRLLFAV